MSQPQSGGESGRRIPVAIYRLGHEPGDDLSATTTVGERLAMVAELSRRMELLLGRTTPPYTRAMMPVDLLMALAASGAHYLIVGAHATAVHGVPRGTQDLGIWIGGDPDNAGRVWDALRSFGAPLADLAITRDDLTRPDTVVQLGLPPARIDLLTGLTGLPDFDAARQSRVVHEFGPVSAPFLDRASLVRTKRASGRRKDLADLEALGELPPS